MLGWCENEKIFCIGLGILSELRKNSFIGKAAHDFDLCRMVLTWPFFVCLSLEAMYMLHGGFPIFLASLVCFAFVLERCNKLESVPCCSSSFLKLFTCS